MSIHDDQVSLEKRVADLERAVQDQQKAMKMHLDDHTETLKILRKLIHAVQNVFTEE